MNKKYNLLKWSLVLVSLIMIGEALFLIFTLKNQKYENFNSSIEYNKFSTVYLHEKPKGIFIGNSITALWAAEDPDFFVTNNCVSRAIGGQTSTHLLVRFQKDVVSLNPYYVVINAGINDIGEATGDYDQDMTMSNIKSMVQLSKANNIKVILTSVTPSGDFDWKPQIKNVSQKIDFLNTEIKKYAIDNNIMYVDYNLALRNNDGSFKKEYTFDGVHPNSTGFEIMKNTLSPFILKMIEGFP